MVLTTNPDCFKYGDSSSESAKKLKDVMNGLSAISEVLNIYLQISKASN
jgi:hypothetical protein